MKAHQYQGTSTSYPCLLALTHSVSALPSWHERWHECQHIHYVRPQPRAYHVVKRCALLPCFSSPHASVLQLHNSRSIQLPPTPSSLFTRHRRLYAQQQRPCSDAQSGHSRSCRWSREKHQHAIARGIGRRIEFCCGDVKIDIYQACQNSKNTVSACSANRMPVPELSIWVDLLLYCSRNLLLSFSALLAASLSHISILTTSIMFFAPKRDIYQMPIMVIVHS